MHQDGHETGSAQIQTGITFQGVAGQADAHISSCLTLRPRSILCKKHILQEDVTPCSQRVGQVDRQVRGWASRSVGQVGRRGEIGK